MSDPSPTTTTEPDTEAAPVEPTDPAAALAADRARLEAEVARRRAEAEAAGTAAPAPRPGLRRSTPAPPAGIEDMLARIRARAGDATDGEPSEETPAQTQARLRADIVREAWATSLRVARFEPEVAGCTLDQLDQDTNPNHVCGELSEAKRCIECQHPLALRAFIDQVGNRRATVLNLLLRGPVGSGKTAAAIAAGTYAASKGLMTRIVRHGTYLEDMRPRERGDEPEATKWRAQQRAYDAELLILDDLGATLNRGRPASDHVQEMTLDVIGKRVDSGKATIITTNEPIDVLAVMIGERAMSRIARRGTQMPILGEDRRRKGSNIRW